MEIEGSDGSKIQLKPNSDNVFGRGNGFRSDDISVSRRHLSFDSKPSPNNQTPPRVSFEVLGKNPVWVFKKQHENGNIKAFKRFKRGELDAGDLFCVSAKNPIWFTLKKVEENVEERKSINEEIKRRVDDELSQSLEAASGFNANEDFELDSVDVSNIDPVQEFGFLVIGHEFDQYPKQMIREIKKWDWFLDDRREESDEEEDSTKKGTTGRRRKRKKTSKGGDDDVDEEWTAESEGEEITTNARKVPKYHTRSKDQGVHDKGRTSRKSSTKTSRTEEEEESEDEEDETLGGFVVNDDTVEEDEIDEDEEDEFVEDEDEDELED